MEEVIKTAPHHTMDNCYLALVCEEGEMVIHIIINGVSMATTDGPNMGQAWKAMTGEDM